MNSKSMMLIFGAAGVLSLPLLCMFFLLFFFAPVGGIGGGTAACQGGPDTTDVGQRTSGKDDNGNGEGMGGFQLPKPDGAGEQNKDAGPIPSNFLAAYKAAGKQYGLPWQLLAGVGEDESGHNEGSVSSVGAQGPMQFMPSTWATYGVDGNGDGVKNMWDIGDAAFGAAKYLVALGVKNGPTGVFGALGKYNGSYPSHVYANDVLKYAWEYATGKVIVVPGQGGQCSPPVDASTIGGRIVQYAQKWLGTPYQFAGGNFHGPTVGVDSRHDGALGFDCSGLTMYAVYNATGGKVALDHYVPSQYGDSRIQLVPMEQLQPGDLVFLDDLGHVGIYVGNQRIIDAPQTGEYVRYDSLAPGSYFYNNFVSGGRVLYGSNEKKS
jgi:hypothetical protein